MNSEAVYQLYIHLLESLVHIILSYCFTVQFLVKEYPGEISINHRIATNKWASALTARYHFYGLYVKHFGSTMVVF